MPTEPSTQRPVSGQLDQPLDQIDRAVRDAQRRHGSCLEVRRARADLDHLRESVALLGALEDSRGAGPGAGRPGPPEQPPPMVTVSDEPYDPALWTDCEDEGIGGARR